MDFGKPENIDFSTFWDAWDLLKKKFMGETDDQKMVYGAISGLAQSLGDPYTSFMSPDDSKMFNEDMNGKFDGIGAEIEASNGYLIIVAPLEGSPAEKAGIRAKDIIVKIDGNDVDKLSFSEAIGKIRGKKGSIVTLNILREGEKEPQDIKVTRDTIVVKSVKYEIKDNVGYVKVNQFGDDTFDLFQEALDKFIDKNVKSVVIDLRNNPGGYLETAVDMAGLFLDKDKTIVIEKKKEGTETTYKSNVNPKMKDKPLVVIVNGGSASASEIFAGAIQDYKRGKLVGEKTFGKGSVQTLEELKDKSQLKITIAEWLTPEKRQINKKGIEPDINVKISDDDKKANKDPQLDKAMEEANK